jgi:hypothetical protein
MLALEIYPLLSMIQRNAEERVQRLWTVLTLGVIGSAAQLCGISEQRARHSLRPFVRQSVHNIRGGPHVAALERLDARYLLNKTLISRSRIFK